MQRLHRFISVNLVDFYKEQRRHLTQDLDNVSFLHHANVSNLFGKVQKFLHEAKYSILMVDLLSTTLRFSNCTCEAIFPYQMQYIYTTFLCILSNGHCANLNTGRTPKNTLLCWKWNLKYITFVSVISHQILHSHPIKQSIES